MSAQRPLSVYRGLVGWRVLCRRCLWSQRSYPAWPVAMHAAGQHYRHCVQKEAAA